MFKQAIIVSLVVGCGAGPQAVDLREAIAQSRVSMHDMVATAEASMSEGRAITSKLVLDPAGPMYAFGTVGAGTLHDIRIDTVEGRILASSVAGAGEDACPGSISIAEAITIAEAQIAEGTVIAAIPDDDVPCAREIQVLDPALQWEVKVAGNGAVLEVEESDETED